MIKTTPLLALVSIVVASILSSGQPVLGQTEAPSIGFFGSYKVADEKVDPATLPFIGAWRMNFDRSDARMRAAGRFAPTATTIFTVENGGVRHAVFNSYPPKVDTYDTVFTPEARSYWFKLDGQNIYENPQGPNDRGQTVGMWLIDLNTIFRERMTKGVIDERVLYRVSPDGQTLTWTGFNSERDSGHVVWDRISLP